MKIFLAGIEHKHYGLHIPYALHSYYKYLPNKPFTFPNCKEFILDSGVFSFLSAKKAEARNMDWYAYADKYAAFVRNNQIQNYVEIDVDRYIGLSEVEKLRDYLEKKVGWQSMPVWHINRGYDKWLEVCKSHKYVCFGAFLTDGLSSRKFGQIRRFLHDAKELGAKVHGLGFIQMKWLPILKFDSVDSTTWMSGCRFGEVHRFNGTKIDRIFKAPDAGKRLRVDSYHELDKINLKEWIKFAEYAEVNL